MSVHFDEAERREKHKDDVSTVISEQIAYYEARAADWDEYAGFAGPYPEQPERNSMWFSDLRLLRTELSSFGARGKVLEIAPGTGMWSHQLARTAAALTVLDSSASMLARNRARCADFCNQRGVEYRTICADLFKWTPKTEYDVVFFAFWLCHVPVPLFDSFWKIVHRCLRRGGRLLFFDSRSRNGVSYETMDTAAPRRLADGREFRVVKIRYPPQELQSLLRAHRIVADVRPCGDLALVGTATFD